MSNARLRITHELKTWPEFFQATLNGRKKFELRRNDRDFKVGDELLLKEFAPPGRELQAADMKTAPFKVGETGLYSGREVLVRVDYIMDAKNARVFPEGHWGALPLAADYIIMSISLIS